MQQNSLLIENVNICRILSLLRLGHLVSSILIYHLSLESVNHLLKAFKNDKIHV